MSRSRRRSWRALADEELVTSGLTRTETMRAVARAYPDPDQRRRLVDRVGDLLDGMHLLAVSDEILRAAGRLELADLRTLDAIHLASAIVVRDELTAVVGYDARLLAAARSLGLATVAPS